MTWLGDKLLFRSDYDSGPMIIGVDPRGGQPTSLVSGTGPVATPDEQTIVYVVRGKAKSDVWKADADGRHPVRLAENAGSPAVTRDRQVIYMSGNSSLWTVSLDDGKSKELVPGPANDPEVSPDGKVLLYVDAGKEHPDGDLMVCDLPECTGRRPLTPVPPGDNLKWMPEGRALAYRYQGNIWVQVFEGGQQYRLTNFTDGVMGQSFAWSRDGSRLATQRGGSRASDVVLFTGLKKKP